MLLLCALCSGSGLQGWEEVAAWNRQESTESSLGKAPPLWPSSALLYAREAPLL